MSIHFPTQIPSACGVAFFLERASSIFSKVCFMPEKPHDMDISYVAHLARLQLTEAEAAQFSTQVKDILKYVEKLNELDVTNVEPTAHAVPMTNVLRKDEVQPSIDSADVLRNAPQQARELFIVPKIVEQA